MRRYIDIWKISFFFLVALLPALAYGVTQKEMEQARTIAAKAYIRYANDGSGYLDDINPATMEELEAQLKPKEKENIKAFKAIPVPSDYKDWNKEKLVEYWAVEAFKNKGLQEKGRGGRIRARSQINKMTIAAAPEPDNQPLPATSVSNAEKVASAASPDSLVNDIKNEEKEIIAEDKLEEEDIKIDKATNYTWVYIMALGILVALVIALVVYAANVFKKNGSPESNRQLSADGSEEIEHLESIIADKDVEIAMLKKKLESEKNKNADLKNRLDSLSEEIQNLKTSAASVSTASRVTEMKTENMSAKQSLRSIYLGRANARGIFVRADRTLNVGNSIYILETTDGFSGTFKVADSPAAWSLALSNPREYLATACTGQNLEDTAGVSKIVTETSGTAIFEGGCWRVIRKAKIRYE